MTRRTAAVATSPVFGVRAELDVTIAQLNREMALPDEEEVVGLVSAP